MQGWLFLNSAFWKEPQINALVNSVPRVNSLVCACMCMWCVCVCVCVCKCVCVCVCVCEPACILWEGREGALHFFSQSTFLKPLQNSYYTQRLCADAGSSKEYKITEKMPNQSLADILQLSCFQTQQSATQFTNISGGLPSHSLHLCWTCKLGRTESIPQVLISSMDPQLPCLSCPSVILRAESQCKVNR